MVTCASWPVSARIPLAALAGRGCRRAACPLPITLSRPTAAGVMRGPLLGVLLTVLSQVLAKPGEAAGAASAAVDRGRAERPTIAGLPAAAAVVSRGGWGGLAGPGSTSHPSLPPPILLPPSASLPPRCSQMDAAPLAPPGEPLYDLPTFLAAAHPQVRACLSLSSKHTLCACSSSCCVPASANCLVVLATGSSSAGADLRP